MNETVEILRLGPIIDPEAFREENLDQDWKQPKNVFWDSKRHEAYRIAKRIIEAGYKYVEG